MTKELTALGTGMSLGVYSWVCFQLRIVELDRMISVATVREWRSLGMPKVIRMSGPQYGERAIESRDEKVDENQWERKPTIPLPGNLISRIAETPGVIVDGFFRIHQRVLFTRTARV